MGRYCGANQEYHEVILKASCTVDQSRGFVRLVRLGAFDSFAVNPDPGSQGGGCCHVKAEVEQGDNHEDQTYLSCFMSVTNRPLCI